MAKLYRGKRRCAKLAQPGAASEPLKCNRAYVRQSPQPSDEVAVGAFMDSQSYAEQAELYAEMAEKAESEVEAQTYRSMAACYRQIAKDTATLERLNRLADGE